MNRSNRGRTEDRGSALWGTGTRGGESRSNALWGKGGRGAALVAVACVAFSLPLAASAGRQASSTHKSNGTSYVAPSLQEWASTHGEQDKVNVIIQSSGGVQAADRSLEEASNRANGANGNNGDNHERQLDLVGGVSARVSVKELNELAAADGLIVTPDAPVKSSGDPYSTQLWPYASGNAKLWSSDPDYTGQFPAIAVIDSGVDPRADFGARLIASVNLSTLPNNSPGDGNGHGTFVAGIAAGAAAGYAGAAPYANLVSVDAMDDYGMGRTSDIIKACQWVIDHKSEYNIRIANLSLQSLIVAPFYYDPLDKAVEKMWFNGITVVASAGNYGTGSVPSGVKFSPADDPFVITVGAADLNGSVTASDHTMAPWSAWGYTMDGFAKPEVSAPGRYMVGPVPPTSMLAILRAASVVAPGYMQLSGTSFAAAVVSGTAAQILARHPGLTPDQVKGALMLTARPLAPSVGLAGGVGEITASKAAWVEEPPNPNKALSQFLVKAADGSLSFNAASWLDTIKANASWNTASWLSASWLSASWNTASWLSASWNTASWVSASWVSAAWLDASWLSASWNTASWLSASWLSAVPEMRTAGPYPLDARARAALAADPALAPAPSVLPPLVP